MHLVPGCPVHLVLLFLIIRCYEQINDDDEMLKLTRVSIHLN